MEMFFPRLTVGMACRSDIEAISEDYRGGTLLLQQADNTLKLSSILDLPGKTLY
jgi:hypothetical protein